MNDLNYFNTGDKSLCSGCGACQQACPFDALSMQPDEEGFIFPVKDLNKCTECGLCDRICPFPNPNYSLNPKPDLIAAFVKDDEQRQLSTSGGLFYLIAKYIIENNGIVFGASIESNMQVVHKGVESLDELNMLRGSKYVQSATNNCFKEVQNSLKNGRLVYYSGCGCQIAGLKAFLRKEYQNLITSDLICHGVPNQELFFKHIHFLERELKGKVIKYKFRDTETWYKNEFTEVETGNGIITQKVVNIFSPYLFAFERGIILRYSCYNCPYSVLPRQGDITLGDFWGIEKYCPDLDPNMGVSMISLNTDKGANIWNQIKHATDYHSVPLNIGIENNHNFSMHTQMPPIRKEIFKLIEQEGYDKVARTLFTPSIKEKTIYYLKFLIKSIVGKTFIDKFKRQM